MSDTLPHLTTHQRKLLTAKELRLRYNDRSGDKTAAMVHCLIAKAVIAEKPVCVLTKRSPAEVAATIRSFGYSTWRRGSIIGGRVPIVRFGGLSWRIEVHKL